MQHHQLVETHTLASNWTQHSYMTCMSHHQHYIALKCSIICYSSISNTTTSKSLLIYTHAVTFSGRLGVYDGAPDSSANDAYGGDGGGCGGWNWGAVAATIVAAITFIFFSAPTFLFFCPLAISYPHITF